LTCLELSTSRTIGEYVRYYFLHNERNSGYAIDIVTYTTGGTVHLKGLLRSAGVWMWEIMARRPARRRANVLIDAS
jgi:hypothetical protein